MARKVEKAFKIGMKKRKQNTINGLSERHVSQIIRRKMIQKVKPSKKIYNRKKRKKDDSKEQ